MRPVNLILIGLALGGFLRPAHVARAQAPAPSGTVITIAGNGMGGFSGDGGPALDASNSGPYGTAIGPDGTLYFADNNNFRIRAVDPATGIITTVAGIGPPPGFLEDGPNGDGGPATSAQIGDVLSIAIDRQRNTLYLPAISLGRVRQLDLATGIIENFAGIGMFDNELFSQDGDGGPATSAYTLFPLGVAVGPDSDVFFTDYFRVRRVDGTTGIINRVAGTVDAQGLPVHMFGGDGGPASAASFNFPYTLTVDSAGDVYVIDSGVSGVDSARVRRIDSATGIIDTIAGGGTMTPGSGLATDMNLDGATDVAVDDAAGLLYVAVWNQVFQMDLATGQLSLFAGLGTAGFSGDGGPALAAEFNNIYGLEVVPGGGLLVSDTDNARIRYIAPDSIHLSGDSGQTDYYSRVSALSGELIIANNPNLSVIDVSSVTTVAGDLAITGNSSATVINAGTLVSVLGDLDISGNVLSGELDLHSLVSSGELTISGNTSATSINVAGLTIVSGDLGINGNTSATTINVANLTTVSGDLGIDGNTAATDINVAGLTTVSGALGIRGNTSATVINVAGLTTVSGDLEITDNTSATSVHISSLTSAGGSVHVDGNTSAMVVDVGGLVSSGGAVSANGNTSAAIVDFGSLVSANGDVTVEDNTSATSVHISSLSSAGGAVSLNDNTSATSIDLGGLTTVGGPVSLNGNTLATSIDLGGLTSAGGAVSLNDNTSATSIDLGSLQSATEVTITGNGNAAVSLGSLESVTGSVTLESTGTGTFALGDADVAGETNLSLDGYTTVGASTAGGATAVTMLNSAATMEVTLPDGAFSSANPVTFSIEKLPGGGVETVDGEMVTQLETYAFDFAIPTLNSAAELNFEINLVALDEPDRLALVDLLHQSAELTIGVRGDAPGAELQLFDVCSGTGATVDSCVVVEWLDETRMLLDPLGSIDPSILRFEALVGHFSTYSVVAVGLAGDYNHDNIVDAADYTVWRDMLGQSGTDLAADGNNSGTIDSGDYDVWKSHFGNVSPGNGTGSGAAADHSAVPEPSSGILMLGSAAFWITRRRIRPSTVDRVYAAMPAAF